MTRPSHRLSAKQEEKIRRRLSEVIDAVTDPVKYAALPRASDRELVDKLRERPEEWRPAFGRTWFPRAVDRLRAGMKEAAAGDDSGDDTKPNS